MANTNHCTVGGLRKNELSTFYDKEYVKQNKTQAFIFKNMLRSEAIGKMEEDNLKGIRPRHKKTLLFQSLPNIAFQLVGEELIPTVPQFPILQANNIGFNIWLLKIWFVSHLE